MDRLVALLKKTFSIDFAIYDDTPLISTGLIDSLHVPQLLSALEKEYGMSIATSDIGTDNFDTPRQMEKFLSASINGMQCSQRH